MPCPFDVAVIIPANNEETWLGRCLDSLMCQDEAAGRLQIIVSANACTDSTVDIAHRYSGCAEARGWQLSCLSSPAPGKIGALNRADSVAEAEIRVYLDADVTCEPAMIGQVRRALDSNVATYATGTLAVVRARSRLTRAYAAFWRKLPFVEGGAVGAGFFAVNRSGRARWGDFPEIISDDTFVRLNFCPAERVELPATYYWPMVEGWRNLVKVRRRQDAGVAEVYRLYPDLRVDEGKARLTLAQLIRLAIAMPVGFLVYASVTAAVRLRPAGGSWSRGR